MRRGLNCKYQDPKTPNIADQGIQCSWLGMISTMMGTVTGCGTLRQTTYMSLDI